MSPKVEYYIERIFSWLAAILLIQTLFYKFSAAEESVYIFSELGVEPYGRIAVGLAELITALLLLYRKTSYIGAIIGIGLMIGAIFSHVFVLGIEVLDDNGLLFKLALIVFVSCSVVLVLEKNQLIYLIRDREILNPNK